MLKRLFTLFIFLLGSWHAALAVPSITCPNPPGVFACDDFTGINNWLGSYTADPDGQVGTFVTHTYNPASFDKCVKTTNTITFSLRNALGLEIATCNASLTINAAIPPTITVPPLPASLTCVAATTYTAPNASYTNNSLGACNISGFIFPSQANNFSECGGFIRVSYMATVECGTLLQAGPFDIPVMPAPEATVSVPIIPATITCTQANSFSIGSASYSNNIPGACNISGTIAPTIEPTWDKCGGIIKVSYVTQDPCNRAILGGPFTISVLPAPTAIITPPPPFPTSISCVLASGFVAPSVTYNNGIPGNCNIVGTINPIITNNWDKCGGTLVVKYQTTDMCGRLISLAAFNIPVDPAPPAVAMLPVCPTNISCEMASTFTPLPASYTNNILGPCNISGTFLPVVENNWDKCGGFIKLTYITTDMCGRPIVGGIKNIIVDPAPPANPASILFLPTITCEMAATFVAPNLPYSNGVAGVCNISGTIPPTVNNNWDKCGGMITITYSGQDMCGRPLNAGPFIINVDPAPPAIVSVPVVPASLTCEMADGYMAPPATYTNGLTGACEISGTIPAVVTPNFDKCGGTITIDWSGQDMCGRPLAGGVIQIPVMPAPPAMVMQPVLPNSLSCEMAFSYTPPDAPYSNGLTGVCEISGTVTGVVTPNFDKCGGTIMVTYNGSDMCGRPLISASFTITVDPAPVATVQQPVLPNSLSCENAVTFMAPDAPYSNGLTGVCEISGTVSGVVTSNFDKCGGSIMVTYNGVDDCGRPLISASFNIVVLPAPAPSLNVPYFPNSVTCEEAQTFIEHWAPYDNGLTGVCQNSGFIQPVVNKYVDACSGGYITLDYSGFDDCGNYLFAPQIYIHVEPAPPAVLTIPETPMMLYCWEAEGYYPGYATYTNGLTGYCENSGIIYPTLMPLLDGCDGGFIIISYSGYDDCGNHLDFPAYKIPILPDDTAPIGECVTIEQSFQFMYQTPEPDELGFYKDSIASHFWDYCNDVVITVVGDTGYPVCGLDGKYQRIYDMEVADECGNVADTCQVIFSGNCNPEYCTLSQSFYAGNGEPDSIFGYYSIEIIDSLIDYGNDPIVIGTGDCGFSLDDPYCIQQLLKGEGTSYFLPQGYMLNCGAPLNNNLINQVITTILNVRYNHLFNGLDFGNYQLSATCKNYPHYMLEAMPYEPTINDLIDYANNFIGCSCTGTCGDFENTPIGWDITCALLALNSRFHECHVPGPCHLDNKSIYDYATPQMLESLDNQQIKNNTFTIGDVSLPDVIDFYPNPANEVLNIRLTTQKSNTYRIKIFGVNGAEILVQDVDMQEGENNKQLNIDHLDRGMYLLFIEGNDRNWSERFVKMKK